MSNDQQQYDYAPPTNQQQRPTTPQSFSVPPSPYYSTAPFPIMQHQDNSSSGPPSSVFMQVLPSMPQQQHRCNSNNYSTQTAPTPLKNNENLEPQAKRTCMESLGGTPQDFNWHYYHITQQLQTANLKIKEQEQQIQNLKRENELKDKQIHKIEVKIEMARAALASEKQKTVVVVYEMVKLGDFEMD